MSGMETFLRTFSHVPDDKLDWAPTPTAKSAMQIAAHTAVHAGSFAKMIRARRLPSEDEIPDFLEQISAGEKALIGRAEVESLFRNNTEEVVAALDTVTPEAIELTLYVSPLDLHLPMTFLMNLPGRHALAHTAQIDYLQTCWGDQEIRF